MPLWLEEVSYRGFPRLLAPDDLLGRLMTLLEVYMNKRKEKREARKRKKMELAEQVLSPTERIFEAILMRERTEEVNSEGYHFRRPVWHRWVYGGGKKADKE